MKNTFLIFVSIFFVFTVGIQAKTRIVEKPPYVYSSTTILEIPRVTLTDTATIVDFEVYYRAGKTVEFSSSLALVDGNGCRYAFRSCEGMVPGKRVRMPESGKLSLSLVFEPLPPKTRSFDFVEGFSENSWKIYGISLTGRLSDDRKEIKRLEKRKIPESGLSLPDTGLTADSAVVTGRIIGFRKDFGRQIEAWYNTVFDGRQQCVTGRVDDNGTFRLSLSVHVPTEIIFSYDEQPLRFFVVPGKTVNVDINLAEWTRRGSRLLREQPSRERSAYFSGAMAGINDEKVHDTLLIGDFWQRYYSSLGKIKAFYKMTVDDYKAYLLHRYDSLCVEIDRQPWSEAYKKINRINNAVWCALLLNRYSLSLRLSYCRFFKGPRDAGPYAFAQQFEYPDSSYFDYLLMLRPYFDDGSIVWGERFGDLVNSITKEVKLKKKMCPDLWQFIEEADSIHHFLSDEERSLLRDISREGYDLLDESDKERVWNMVDAHKRYLKFFLGVISRKGNVSLPVAFFGEESTYFDWAEAQRCYVKLKENYTPLDQDDMASLRAMDDTMFYRILSADSDSLSVYLKHNRALSSQLDAPLDSLSGEDLFAALVAPYRGKIVLVDFWETWCSPCRIAMQQMVPLKRELAGKDIVYLYLATDGSSNKETWSNLIEAVPGYHILLSLRQGRSLSSLLGISGVPTFIIVDRQGNRVKKLTGYPGVETMRRYLLDALDR